MMPILSFWKPSILSAPTSVSTIMTVPEPPSCIVLSPWVASTLPIPPESQRLALTPMRTMSFEP